MSHLEQWEIWHSKLLLQVTCTQNCILLNNGLWIRNYNVGWTVAVAKMDTGCWIQSCTLLKSSHCIYKCLLGSSRIPSLILILAYCNGRVPTLFSVLTYCSWYSCVIKTICRLQTGYTGGSSVSKQLQIKQPYLKASSSVLLCLPSVRYWRDMLFYCCLCGHGLAQYIYHITFLGHIFQTTQSILFKFYRPHLWGGWLCFLG